MAEPTERELAESLVMAVIGETRAEGQSYRDAEANARDAVGAVLKLLADHLDDKWSEPIWQWAPPDFLRDVAATLQPTEES